ncbi:hypothetical protein [Bacillus wiedmannii]|nr:hypothetical protein [Bacillus wiedmannii]
MRNDGQLMTLRNVSVNKFIQLDVFRVHYLFIQNQLNLFLLE